MSLFRPASVALVATVLVLLTGCGGPTPKDDFEAYRKAVMEQRGEDAVALVSKRTLDYYDSIVKHVRETEAFELNQLSIADRMFIFRVRVQIDPDEVAHMTGKELYVHGVNKGWVSKNMKDKLSHYTIEETVANERAQMKARIQGQMVPMFTFYKEEGFWKIDITSLHPMLNMALKQQLPTIDENENEALLKLIESMENKEYDLEVVLIPMDERE